MPSYKELLAQREQLEAKIQAARAEEVSAVVEKIREQVAAYGLTAEDIFNTGRGQSGRKSAKVAAKYKNPETGETWTGRGKPPKWIQDKDRDQFLIPGL